MKACAVVLLVALMGCSIDARGGPAVISNEPRCVAINNAFSHHFPDPADCSCFYQCAWSDAIQHCCPEDNQTPNHNGYLVFNPTLEVCDRLNNAVAGGAVCGGGGPDPTSAPTPEPTTISTPTPPECCACPTTPSPPTPPTTTAAPTPTTTAAPPSSSTTDECTEPPTEPTPSTVSPPPPSPSTSPPPTPTVPAKDGCAWNEASCPPNNEFYHSYPHETCANKWCQCDWGHAIIQPCPSGLVFNPVLQVCDWPQSGSDPNMC